MRIAPDTSARGKGWPETPLMTMSLGEPMGQRGLSRFLSNQYGSALYQSGREVSKGRIWRFVLMFGSRRSGRNHAFVPSTRVAPFHVTVREASVMGRSW